MHFTGYKAVGESVRELVKYYRNNSDTTLTLLEMMKEYDVKRILFSSSATVYGNEHPVPFTETMERGKCTNPYGWTKSMIEQILSVVVLFWLLDAYYLLQEHKFRGMHNDVAGLNNGIIQNPIRNFEMLIKNYSGGN